MLNIPAGARRVMFALCLTTLMPVATPVVVAHAQGAPAVPANYVSAQGDGWTLMVPGDWTLSAPGTGLQTAQGKMNGTTAAVTVIRAAGAPADYTVARWLTDFKASDAMKGAQFGNETAGPPTFRGGLASASGGYATDTAAGLFLLWLENGTAWALVGSALGTDPAVTNAGLDGLSPILGSFQIS